MQSNPTPIRRPVGRSTPPGGGSAPVAAFACMVADRVGSPPRAAPTANTALVAPGELTFEDPSSGPFPRSHEFYTLLNTRAVDSVWSPGSSLDGLRIPHPAGRTVRRGPAGPGLPSTCHSPGPDASVAARTPSKPEWSPEITAVAVNRFPHAGFGTTDA
jgi:hypothetical protein